jgi:hypothetical protein
MDNPDPNVDFIQEVLESALRLLKKAQHDGLPDGGIHDLDIARDTGLELPTVRAALLGLGEDELDVEVRSSEEPWVVVGTKRGT